MGGWRCLPSHRHHETFGLGEFFLVSIEGKKFSHSQMQCGRNVENVKAAMTAFPGMLKSKSLAGLVNGCPINCRMTIKPHFHIRLKCR